MDAEPKKVLEIACGSGRFLVPMAKAGHDFDAYMLERIAPITCHDGKRKSKYV